ncbi:MAG: Ig-like domain-containing protein [Oscillospiraceae bacterium]|nr:Ig-like domain-containing protein [Oscillospiraceae bacterium]
MTLTKKKLPALLLALAMLIALIPVFNVKAGAATYRWMNSAKTVKSGSTYSTTMAKNGDWSTYKVSVKHDGVIKIDLTAKADYTAVEVRNSYGEKISLKDCAYKTGWFEIYNGNNNSYAKWNENSGKSVTRAVCSVTKGTYYVRFAHRDGNDNVCTSGSGKISIKLTFPTTASEKDDAKQLFSGEEITVKNSYIGEKQVYVLNARKSGELKLDFSTEMSEASVKLYNKNFEDQVDITGVSTYGGEVKSGGVGYDYLFVKSWTDTSTTNQCNSTNYDKNIKETNSDIIYYNNFYYKLRSHSHYNGTITFSVKKGLYYLVVENTGSLCQSSTNLVYSFDFLNRSSHWEYYYYYDVSNCPNYDLSDISNPKYISPYDKEVMKIKAVFDDAGEIKTTPAIDPDISMSLKKGKTLNAAALCELTGTIKWTTSNKNIATVSTKGKVTAKKAGTVYITGTSGKKTFIIKLTIK